MLLYFMISQWQIYLILQILSFTLAENSVLRQIPTLPYNIKEIRFSGGKFGG